MANKKSLSRNNAIANQTRLRYTKPVDFSEIRRRRKELGMTQAQAAKKAGWANAQVWMNMESGQRQNPRVGTLRKIADVLGCKMDDLLRK